jgi:FkbM family methyltransferase
MKMNSFVERLQLIARMRRELPLRQYVEIGGYRIQLARRSMIPVYRANHERYDVALGDIARIAYGKYPDLHAIDIGANVGDTAALIRSQADIPVLCIEGDMALLPVLESNARTMGPLVTIVPSYVGPDGLTVDTAKITDRGRNSSIVGAVSAEGGECRLKSLRSVLADHPAFAQAKLLKTDTEGFDFDILRQSMEFLRDTKPVVFTEYCPGFRPEQPRAGLETIQEMISVGYRDFIYYDNFGNFLIRVGAQAPNQFEDLHSYLAANQRFGTVVDYFDICAFHTEDADLADALQHYERDQTGSA